MNNIKIYIIVLITAFTITSCEDYLTVLPENNQSSYEYWETKEEVEAVLGAGYVEIRSSIETIFLWGEARGNGISFYASGSDLRNDAAKLRDMNILTSNNMSKWERLYKVVSMANSVIKYAPDVVDKDPSFDENVMNSFLSEAYFLRSLAYFYLVRTFDEVPFVTEPYVDDSAPYLIGKTKGNEILKTCLEDLEKSLVSAKEFFPENDGDENLKGINTKGRATRWALYSLMADINLWLGNYDECIDNCQKIIDSKRVGLISGDYWFSNFYKGNSNESIFEIQYSYILNQTNSFSTWFAGSNPYYIISSYSRMLFNQDDVRGEDATYRNGLVWKYVGRSDSENRLATENDQNYIIYRLADIYLMQAEAYIMLENYETGMELINKIRERAGISSLNTSNDKYNMITILLEERQREFVAEGKNWFDLLRIGRRSLMGEDARFKNLLINQVLSGASVGRISYIRAALEDSGSWYLPIHRDEMNANPLLTQSDYYMNLGN